MITKKKITLIIGVFAILISLPLGSKVVDTVKKGTYQVKQAAITGNMSAKMTPGLWLQLFGEIQVWPKAETFYFTADLEEGEFHDQSIEVRFNEGSLCRISGTARIILPVAEERAINLITQSGYRSYEDMEQKLILPVVRNALRLTANLMSARQSYADKRPDYITWAWDQIQNGLYATVEETRNVIDPVSGEMVTKTFKIIMRDKTGNPIYQRNPLEDTGITLANFEIKEFVYADKVKAQIAAQQEALMAVETAIANSKRAEQDALTVEAQGKAKVMIAKYEKEQEKVRAVVDAQKEKEVAVLQAQKELDVSKLQKDAAGFTKRKEILLGQGEAERKRLVMAADGALKQKLETYLEVNRLYADAMAKYQGQWVPNIVMGQGSGQQGNGAQELINLFTIKAARDLSLDMSVQKGK